MKVEFSSIAASKLKAASAEDQWAVNGITKRLNAACHGIGGRLTGVENGFQIRAARGGPVVLYSVSPEGVATVQGLITSLQRKLATSPSSRAGTVRRGSKKSQAQWAVGNGQ